MTATQLLSPGGAIARRLTDFEARPQQQQMAELVARAFDERQHLLIEAGTGVGKSFAYLLPAIQRVTEHGDRVVISTNTIALQEQLVYKDIPFLDSVLPQEFSAVLVKGRGNYVGLRRLAQASRRQEVLFESSRQLDQLWQIEDWAYKTTDGSLADLPVQPDPSVWERARSEHGNCLGRRCDYYNKCFYQQARRRARHAKLLIVNHALFFADLAVRRNGAGILPDYDFVILDEAHTIPQVAGDHIGQSITDAQLRYVLTGLYNPRTRRGLLVAFHAESAIRAVIRARDAADHFFNELMHWQQTRGRPNGRLTEPIEFRGHLLEALRDVESRLKTLRAQVENEEDRFEINASMERIANYRETLEEILKLADEQWVYWIDISADRNRRVTLNSRPIDVAPVLKESLFGCVPSVVMTSATLTLRDGADFKYMRERVGLSEGLDAAVGSPFDYRSQVKLYLDKSMPDPRDAATYTEACCAAIRKYIRMSDGRAFVLFTGYDLLRRCAEKLQPFFDKVQMTLLVQGSGTSRSLLLKQFREDARSVIFGTDSFWTGVDVPGDALSNVIITRLPFAVPDRPDTEARIERLRSTGRNPFTAFQLPEAILKLKQGFGRLIRHRNDRGMVAILDPRVRTKGYGKAFLAALPECELIETSGHAPGAVES